MRLGAHPHVVQAHWVDEIAGIVCVAAEMIEPDEIGRVSLRDYLRFGALDFGIASAAPPAAEAQQARLGCWQAGRLPVAGTPPYMAPEQIAGSASQDQQRDIYSFGVVLYGWLMGNCRSPRAVLPSFSSTT
ncbi:MAG: hypothetical protein JO227_20345 [Acetobacteraceae bacterium]|nr:hypothetical protein [Acetobacteraceae bacterium]